MLFCLVLQLQLGLFGELGTKQCLKRVFIKNPIDVIFKILSCLQHWQVLLKGDDGEKLDRFRASAEDWVKDFCNRNVNLNVNLYNSQSSLWLVLCSMQHLTCGCCHLRLVVLVGLAVGLRMMFSCGFCCACFANWSSQFCTL